MWEKTIDWFSFREPPILLVWWANVLILVTVMYKELMLCIGVTTTYTLTCKTEQNELIGLRTEKKIEQDRPTEQNTKQTL